MHIYIYACVRACALTWWFPAQYICVCVCVCVCARVCVCVLHIEEQQAQSINISIHPLRPNKYVTLTGKRLHAGYVQKAEFLQSEADLQSQYTHH